ncbi:MAG TPA: 4'-phosphopantetheinyl transferase superfamily protein, partial [Bacteroidetes bacterium]|nr:4'-phosphopantetheinyl transferase superfamily protein [Bacteroidota bacterium]HEX04741.1 4'-phosphopantetheinyl transferase superfamily protein [Bacteroidota bacterium]
AKRLKGRGGIFYGDEVREGKLAMLYPGHGAQYPEMMSELCMYFPQVREWFDVLDKEMLDLSNVRASKVVYPPPTNLTAEDREERIRELLTGDFGIGLTIFTDYAMDELLRETFGIKPDVMLGHSTGEISAIANSGYFNKPDKFSHTEPTKIIQETFTGFRDDLGGLPTGAVLTVGAAKRGVVEQIIEDSKGKLAFVLDNCPNQVMIYGSEKDILEAKLNFEKAGGICERLPFDRALHTPDFKGISERLAEKLELRFFAKGDTKLFSATKGDYYPDDLKTIQQWCTDLWHEPVMFRSAIERLYEDGVRYFIEVGTSSSLTGFVNDTLMGKDFVAVASDNMRKGDVEQIDTLLAQLYMNGRYPRFEGLYEHREVEQVPTRPSEVKEEKLSPTNKVLVRDIARTRISPEMLKKLDERFPNRGLHAIAIATGQQVPEPVSPEPVAPTSPVVSENGQSQPAMTPVPVDPSAPAPAGHPQFDPYGSPLPDPNMVVPPQLDQWGNPLPPMPAPPPMPPQQFDAYGNPIPQLDAYGNPIPPQQAMVDQWGNPLPPQPQFDQWGNPIPPQQWGPDFFGGGSPGVSPPPLMDSWGNPVDAWGNPLPPVDPYMAPPPPMMDPYGQPMPDPYAPPVQPVDAYPPPTAPAPAEMMPTEPAVPVAEVEAPVVEAPATVAEAEPAPTVVEPAVAAVEATPEEVIDPKDLPYGEKPALSDEQMLAQLADPNTPDAPEHMVMRFDPELAVTSDHYPRSDLNGLPFESAYPWLGKVISQDENYLECERHLSNEKDLVLKSHAFGGPPSRHQRDLHAMTLVPFVTSMEICAEAACCLAGGKKFAKTFKNIRGHRWLALPQDTLDITIKAKKLKDLEDGDTLIRTEIYQNHTLKDGTSEPHLTFEAMIVVGDKEHEAIAPMPFKVKDPRHSHFTDEMLYNDGILYNIHYPGRFHGRHFRAIKHIRHYSPQTVEVEMEAPDWDDLFANIQNPQFQFDQFIMDAAGVQVGLYYSDIFMMNPDLLPFYIRELKLFGGPPPPGRKIIGRAANRLSGVGDIELSTHPYLNHLDKEGNILFQIDENTEEAFDFPDNHYKSEMLPNLGCLDSFVDLIDAETGHVYVRAEGWQVRFFEIPRRLSKITQYPKYYTLSEKWMSEETGYRMRINEPFITDVLTSSWGVWGSTLVHIVLTKAEKEQYYSFEEDHAHREDWLMGRIALKEVLISWIEENTTEGRLNPVDIEIRVDEHGKPFGVFVLNEDLTLPEISIAHSKRYAVAVTSDGSVPIGIDYEWLDGFEPEDVLSGGFSPQNIERIEALSGDDKKRATAALWCSKEAASKAFGTGLNHEPREWLVGSWDMEAGSATIQYKDERFHTRFWFTEAGEVVAVCERGSLSSSDDDDDSESDSTKADKQAPVVEPVAVSPSSSAAEPSSGSGDKASYATTEPFDSSESSEDEIDWDDPDREPTDLEYELIEMWEDLLDLDDIGLHDDFFELGGESVLAVRLIGQVEKKMGRSIPVANFLKTRTVAQMARILSDEDWKPDWSSLVPMRVTGERTPLFFTHPVGGNVLKYRELISFIPEEQPLYALQARGLDGKDEPFNNVPEMAEYYLKGIRAAQKNGPYLLAGFSGGGVISWEMAYQLEQAGEKVALLALFDTFGPGYYSLEVGGSRLPHQLETFLWRIELHMENLKTLSTKEKIAYLRRKIKHGNRKSRDGSGGTIRRVEDLTYEAVLSYKPKKLENVPVALLRASNQPKKSTRDPQLNWGPFVGENNLEVFEVYGTHGHLIEQPHVVGLAKTLNEVLDRTHARLK